AVGWLMKEALERIPRRVDIPDEMLEKLPGAGEHAGQKLDLEPLQVVGKKCAASGKTISYEPDARVCVRCERAYLKGSVPRKCKCGNALAHLRPEGSAEETGDTEEADADDQDKADQEDSEASGHHSSEKMEASEEAAKEAAES